MSPLGIANQATVAATEAGFDWSSFVGAPAGVPLLLWVLGLIVIAQLAWLVRAAIRDFQKGSRWGLLGLALGGLSALVIAWAMDPALAFPIRVS